MVTEFTQPISYQSYNLKGEYQTIYHSSPNEHEPDVLALMIRYELQVQSSRQYQTVFFYSQFLNEDVTAQLGKEYWESFSCSLSNEADGLIEFGPNEGKSLTTANYFGQNLFIDEGGFYNSVNLKDLRPNDGHQIWHLHDAELIHKAGNTDSDFICSMERDFVDEKATMQLRIGQELVWINGYKVFELKSSEGLDRFYDHRTTMTILD